MNKEKHHITVFEHETLRTDKGGKKLSEKQLKALQLYHGEDGVPFYSLCYNGVKFNEYVGVIQIGKTVIEVLPKADKVQATIESESTWRNLLIGMLRAVGNFEIKSSGTSKLKIRSNTILDLYFEIFINEIEALLHGGLVKKYRKTEQNAKYLKGSLQFGKHIQQNLVHKERFFVRHTVYDVEHQLHKIIYKALRLLKQINTKASLSSKIGALLLNFPEMPDMKVNESTFSKLVYDRKTKVYKKSIEIARLLLLQYHPDLSKGQNHVLALMFDMNMLWEKFVFISLKRNKQDNVSIIAQSTRNFWKPDNGYSSRLKPDIVINPDTEQCIVLDTKWKNLNGINPSPEDLRQMFAYMKYYNAKKVALVYPGIVDNNIGGKYYTVQNNLVGKEECSIITIAVEEEKQDIRSWSNRISENILKWSIA